MLDNEITTVVIKEFLSGIERSVFIFIGSKNYKILPEEKDYNYIGEDDTGLNRGGMGSISPVRFANKEWIKKIEEIIISPTIERLTNQNFDYKGFIFLGIIKVGKNYSCSKAVDQ